jgi:hypothetical protein
MFSTLAVAKDKTTVSYMVETITPRLAKIHFDTAIQMNGIQMFSTRFSSEPKNALVSEFGKLPYFESGYLERYDISFYLKKDIDWAKVRPEVMAIIKAYFDRIGMPPLKEVSPLQKSACEYVKVSSSVAETDVSIKQTCIPDRRFVIMQSDKLLTTRVRHCVWQSATPLSCKLEDIEIVAELAQIPGIDGIDIRDRQLIIARAALADWKDIMPKVLATIKHATGNKTSVTSVTDTFDRYGGVYSSLFPKY